MVVICIFGDSITYGAGDTESQGWVGRLRRALEQQLGDVEVYNLGISGDDTRGLLQRFSRECDARMPDVILIAIGTNDAQYIHSQESIGTPIEEFKENLLKLIDLGQEYCDRLAFIGPVLVDDAKTNPVMWNPDKSYSLRDMKTYATMIEGACIGRDVPYLSLLEKLIPADLIDGLHPNARGYEKMAAEIMLFLNAHKLLVG